MQNMMQMFGFLMVIIYIGAGLFFLLGADYLDMNTNLRVGFGLIVLFYGLFRAYQIYLHFKIKREEAAEEEAGE